VDFDEDTSDGKHTFLATATAVFLFRDASEAARKAILDIQEPANEKSLSTNMSLTSPQLLPCNVRIANKNMHLVQSMLALQWNKIQTSYKAAELSWLLVRHYQRNLLSASSDSECPDGLKVDLLDLEAGTEEAMDTTDNVDDDQTEPLTEKDVTHQRNDESTNIHGNETQQNANFIHQTIPPWSGFNSCVPHLIQQ